MCKSTGTDTQDFYLPDYTPGTDKTGWSKNYLNWFFTQLLMGNTPDIPAEDRLTAAKRATKTLIDNVNPDKTGGYEERVRFGITTFDTSSSANGGIVRVRIGPGNKGSLMSYIDSIGANGWTPLSEALVDIGRYFAGTNRLGSYAQYDRQDNSGSVPPSPIDNSCRKNFVVIVTDGSPTQDLNNHHGSSVSGKTYDSHFGDTIGNSDADSNEDPDAISGRTTSFFTPPYRSNGTDWLDDVAYYLKNTDLDPIIDGAQNLVTYTIGFNIDHPLLKETADNGSGRYYTTSDADTLAVQLGVAFQEIIERSASFSAATVPTSRTAFRKEFYTAFFKARATDAFWPGHLQAYRLSPDLVVLDKNGNPAIDPATNQFKEPRAPFWDAQTELSKPAHPPRNLYTTQSGAQTSFDTGTIAANDLDLESSELTLYPNYPTITFADTEALADGLVRYLKGQDTFDKDVDGDTSELRDFVLGDIFHSDPVVIGPPSLFLSGEEAFGPPHDASSFLGRHSQRERRIYAGANDGMLHAFNSGAFHSGDNPATPETEYGYYDLGNGEEAFGYVPGFLLDKLKYIPRNLPRQYYYVDGSPSAADVWLPSSPSDPSKEADEWATVLVTGMRQGGSGYLALDVTDPSASSGPHGPYPKLLWEFDESDAPLGETWSEPVITRVKLKTGSTDLCGFDDSDDGACRERWVAIFAGGYRKDGDPNLAAYVSDPGSAAWTNTSKGIFMVAMDTGQLIGQVLFDPDPSEVLNQMRFSIPSTPASRFRARPPCWIWTSTASPMWSTSEISAARCGAGTSRRSGRTTRWATASWTTGQWDSSSSPIRRRWELVVSTTTASSSRLSPPI
jgi:type IV pilus assembly protein PilY1